MLNALLATLSQHTFFIYSHSCSSTYPVLFENHLIALLGMLHLVCRTNSPLIFTSLVRYSLVHFHISHKAVYRLHHPYAHVHVLIVRFTVCTESGQHAAGQRHEQLATVRCPNALVVQHGKWHGKHATIDGTLWYGTATWYT